MANKTPAERVADNVRAELSRSNISQTTLGRHLSLGQSSVSRRLRGEVPFNVTELHTIAALINVPISFLVTERTVSAAA